MARCLAVAISQAPGLSGTPDCGHCSSAATSASCARSSARPTSRTIRVSPAISLGDSILQTASMVRCISVAATATDHTIFDRLPQVEAPSGRERSGSPLPKFRSEARDPSFSIFLIPRSGLLLLGTELLWPEHLAHLGLAFPTRPVFLVQFHEAHRTFDCLFLRFQFKLGVAADHFLGFGERPVGYGHLATRKPDASTQRCRPESAASNHG